MRARTAAHHSMSHLASRPCTCRRSVEPGRRRVGARGRRQPMQGRLRRRRWKRWCRWQLMMHAVSEIRLQHASHACFPIPKHDMGAESERRTDISFNLNALALRPSDSSAQCIFLSFSLSFFQERLNRSIKLQAAGPSLSSASWLWSMEFR
jgi:hypothetical protein